MAKIKIPGIFGHESLNKDLGELVARLHFLPDVATETNRFIQENPQIFQDTYSHLNDEEFIIDISNYQKTIRDLKSASKKTKSVEDMVAEKIVNRLFPENDINMWKHSYQNFQRNAEPIMNEFAVDFLIPTLLKDGSYFVNHKFIYMVGERKFPGGGPVKKPVMDYDFIPEFTRDNPESTLVFTSNIFIPATSNPMGILYISERAKYGDSLSPKAIETIMKSRNRTQSNSLRIPGEDLCQDLLGIKIVTENYNQRVPIAREILKKIFDEKGLPQTVNLYLKGNNQKISKENIVIRTNIYDSLNEKIFDKYDTIEIVKTGAYTILIDAKRLKRDSYDPSAPYKAIHMNISMPILDGKTKSFYTFEVQIMDSLNDIQEAGSSKQSRELYRKKLESEKRKLPVIMNYAEQKVLQNIFDKV